ncbi:MAG: helix-turn-helix domain-containing protein [Coriobacteriaceae bacterium]|nr:helix-turn-helix domain-containing protein [Coriobacteriaceae bacterium]
MQLSDRIKLLLDQQGLTQAGLCRAANMESSQVTQLLTGKIKDPRLSTAIKIAEALDVSLDYLAGRSTTDAVPEKNQGKMSSGVSTRKERMAEHIEKLNEADARAVLAYINTLNSID